MSRKYDLELVKLIQEKQYTGIKRDVEITIKPIPDCEIEGAMDPRLYQTQKKIALLTRLIPKRLLTFDTSPKSIRRLRKMFNGIDSTPIVDEKIEELFFTVAADDGYEIPMVRFQTEKPIEKSPVLYFIHGGGFFAGSIDVIREALRFFVQRTNMIAVGIDYRLAPENPYPIGHKDCYTGLKWLKNNVEKWGADEKSLFVAGDSAGGNLAAYCTNRAIEDKSEMVCGQILLYPTVNMAGIKDQYTDFDINQDINIYQKQEKVIKPGIEVFSNLTAGLADILGTTDLKNIYLTPYFSVSPKTPPTFISSGEHDYLTIESLAYAKKLKDLNVETHFTLYEGMGHAYIDNIGNYPQAEDCINDISDFIRKYRK